MGQYTRKRLYEGKGSNGNSGGGGGSDAFNGNRPITRNTPGIIGVNLGTNSIADTLAALLYPQLAPESILTVDNPVREIGGSVAYTLSWQAVRKTNPILGITVDGVAKVPTGNTQSGTQSGNQAGSTGSFTKSMTATDGGLSSNASCTIQYLPRMFWGVTAKNGTSQPITDADILALTGSELRTDRLKDFTNLGGDNKRLCFAWPSEFGTPQFLVNGLANTAFTKVRSLSDFVNANGATITMDVWLSDNLYNSPLDTVSIK